MFLGVESSTNIYMKEQIQKKHKEICKALYPDRKEFVKLTEEELGDLINNQKKTFYNINAINNVSENRKLYFKNA